MANCLITGVAGFIGSHLCEALLSRGMEVLGVDCLTDSYSVQQKRDNLKQISQHPNATQFRFQEMDVLGLNLGEALRNVDFVFHLAAEPGVRLSWGENFEKYVTRNILVTQRLLEGLKGERIKKFVFASSSSVYGNRGQEKMTENDVCRPYSPYGVTKLASEQLCLAYAENFKIPVVALRFFTVFGPRQRPDMAFHRFLKAACEGRALQVFGTGEQSRDFTYVSDAVDGLILAGENGRAGSIYNIGGGCIATIQVVLRELAKFFVPKEIEITFSPAVSGDVNHTRSEITKAHQELGFTPKITLQNGLRQQYEWHYLELCGFKSVC